MWHYLNCVFVFGLGRVPMRSSSLVLLLLIGVQAVLNMGGGLARSAGAPNHKVGQQTAANHRARQQHTVARDHLTEEHTSKQHHRTSHHRTKRPHRAVLNAKDRSPLVGHSTLDSLPDPSIPVVDPKLFSKRRYRFSPRVVFSEVPPSHDALEGEGYEIDGVRGVRVRRRAGSRTMHRGEYSVCDSMNTWVSNLTKATDMYGNEVEVLPNVTINNVVKKQYFYETTCRSPTQRGSGNANGGKPGGWGGKQGSKSGNSGCLGIDSRHWNSYCTNSHIFVSALTTFNEQTAWRYIRINAACVCVLSRKSWGGRRGHWLRRTPDHQTMNRAQTFLINSHCSFIANTVILSHTSRQTPPLTKASKQHTYLMQTHTSTHSNICPAPRPPDPTSVKEVLVVLNYEDCMSYLWFIQSNIKLYTVCVYIQNEFKLLMLMLLLFLCCSCCYLLNTSVLARFVVSVWDHADRHTSAGLINSGCFNVF